MQFFWYDYETFGTDPRKDRAVQFAGVRTDANLREIEEPLVLYCRPAPDYLPSPGACIVHGITPGDLARKGLSESEFAARVYAELTRPGTCTVGYNAMRFDHEVTRFLFWRNLREPYGWHWKSDNSRWDVIELMRAAYALRPDGMEWPTNKSGKPSFRLEDLAAANRVLDGRAHDALADVQATLALSRRVRKRNPRLFAYYLGLRNKKAVQEATQDTFVWINHKIPTERHCTAVMARVGRDFDNPSVIYAYDLSLDPTDLMAMSDDELYDRIFPARRGRSWAGLYRIGVNSSPFVVAHTLRRGSGKRNVLSGSVKKRHGIDEQALREHYRILRSNRPFAHRVSKVFARNRRARPEDGDVDRALYAGFVGREDRETLDRLLDENPTGAGERHFEDARLPELVFRYRARNFPEALEPHEKSRWLAHCRAVLHTPHGEDGATAMDRFAAAIAAERKRHPHAAALLEQWEAYGKELLDALDRGTLPSA